MTNFFRNLVNDERGQDTIECSLFIGVVAVVGIAACCGHGISLKKLWAGGIEHLAAFSISTD